MIYVEQDIRIKQVEPGDVIYRDGLWLTVLNVEHSRTDYRLLMTDDTGAQRSRSYGTATKIRRRAKATTPRPKPDKISGCTCGGIGDTGAHSQGCPWR